MEGTELYKQHLTRILRWKAQNSVLSPPIKRHLTRISRWRMSAGAALTPFKRRPLTILGLPGLFKRTLLRIWKNCPIQRLVIPPEPPEGLDNENPVSGNFTGKIYQKTCKYLAKNQQRTNAINEHLPQIFIHRPAGFGKIPRGGGATASGRIQYILN